MEIKKEYLDYGYFAAIILVFVLFFTGYFSAVSGYTLVVIENPDPNSMYPSYFQGDLFLIYDAAPEEISLGDVVVYEKPNGDRIIHRIIDIQTIDGDQFYRIKGDNPQSNFPVDTVQLGEDTAGHLIPHELLLGKVVKRIPFLGHLSLAMQRNIAIRTLVYVIAAVIAGAIVFWPEDKKEEEEENKNDGNGDVIIITTATITALFKSILYFPKNQFLRLKHSKHRNIVLLGTGVLLFLLVLPMFVLALVPVDGNGEIGIKSIEVDSRGVKIFNDKANSKDFAARYMQLRVQLFDNTGIWSEIKSFAVDVYLDSSNPSSRISHTVWRSLHDFSGTIVIGASIIIQGDDIPADGTPLDIVVTASIKGFLVDEVRTFEITYNYNT